jgi:RNA polymerase sigma-70 factor (ECF subfamily)
MAAATAPIQAGLDCQQEVETKLPHLLPRFRSLATRWLGNREDAEDAVQDAMLSAFTHIASFNRRAKMSTWLTAIVSARCACRFGGALESGCLRWNIP